MLKFRGENQKLKIHFSRKSLMLVGSSADTFEAHQVLDAFSQRDLKAIIYNGLVVPYWEDAWLLKGEGHILDSRNCVEVYCDESDFDYLVTVLRLFYVNITKCPLSEMWNGVKYALCILRVELGCPQIITACVSYMESVPWEEAEEVEEEIQNVLPGMGRQAELILTRLQPVNLTV
ncbi:hypothetical protein LguiA_030035 [Lonicera macranthoides]